MELTFIDWAIIAGYVALVLLIGFAFRKRAGSSMAEYFVSGRSLPWWIAGTSMVATTFAADTPLAVTGLIAKNGLAGNWLWWAMAMGGMVTVFVFARLWRRSEVLTDVELIELRYKGFAAAFLRFFRSIYVALLINSIIIGWVTGAMLKVLKHTVLADMEDSEGIDWMIIGGMLLVVGLYSTLAGLWGVAVTDFIQFFLAMGGCIALAVIAVDHVGGIEELQNRVTENFEGGAQAFSFFPDFWAENPWMPLEVFLVMFFVQWWATWYPGAEPGGGGYIVQRMAACKNERHALLATLWYQIAHYCLRPWPWILVAFAALAMFPALRTAESADVGFPMVMRELAPEGLRGLMLVTFGAAFMSTISTQMNWGASYLVNDVYKRFLKKDADDRQLARAARGASILVLILGGFAAFRMRNVDIGEAWKFLLALGAGTGAVFILRWFWWRINAWTEITAMVASLVYYFVLGSLVENETYLMLVVAVLTIVTWFAVTVLTPPVDQSHLVAFYRKVRPDGPGWDPIAREAPDIRPDGDLGRSLLAAVIGSALIYLVLRGTGAVIFSEPIAAAACIGGAAGCGVALIFLRPRLADIDPTPHVETAGPDDDHAE